MEQEPKNNMEEKMNHDSDVKRQWEESQKNYVIEQLTEGKSIQEIMNGIAGLKEAFSKELDTLVCSDERVPAGQGTKAGIAGVLILASDQEIETFANVYKGKIKTVTSHDGCGAAAKAFADLQASGGEVPGGVENGDQLGMLHAKKLAEKLGAVYRHIPSGEMSGDLHNARVIYFDGTAKFNPDEVNELPEGFVCTGPGFGLSKEYCQEELKILSGIALGGHGFGEKFTAEEPFRIIVSAQDENQGKELEAWASEAVAQYNGRVVVHVFVAPL